MMIFIHGLGEEVKMICIALLVLGIRLRKPTAGDVGFVD